VENKWLAGNYNITLLYKACSGYYNQGGCYKNIVSHAFPAGHVQTNKQTNKLGSVAGPVIQATGRSEFEDGLGSGDFLSDYSYHMSVRTRLPDITKQTKFQSHQPSDVKNTCSL
jgi:hypothetical protein